MERSKSQLIAFSVIYPKIRHWQLITVAIYADEGIVEKQFPLLERRGFYDNKL